MIRSRTLRSVLLVGLVVGLLGVTPTAAADERADDAILRSSVPGPDEPSFSAYTAAGLPSYFVPVAAYRAYDSRWEAQMWFSGESAPVNVLLDELGNGPMIPPSATAVAFNVTVTNTIGRGYVQIAGPGVELGATSTLNWNGFDQVIANSGSVEVGAFQGDPGYVMLYLAGRTDAGADIVIDITGYYEPLGG